MDSGVFTAVQTTAGYALGDRFEDLLDGVLAPYRTRREVMVAALRDAGYEVFASPATFYVWSRVPAGGSSVEFCGRVLDEIGVVVTPGLGFGPGGEGWFRISLTASDAEIAARACSGPSLNPLMSLDPRYASALRLALSRLLRASARSSQIFTPRQGERIVTRPFTAFSRSSSLRTLL